MLDNCSQAKFVKEWFLGYLCLQGREASMKIKRMNRKVTKISRTLEDLEVLQVSERKRRTKLSEDANAINTKRFASW